MTNKKNNKPIEEQPQEQPKTIQLSTLSDIELKSLAFDLRNQIDQQTSAYQTIMAELVKRQTPPQE